MLPVSPELVSRHVGSNRVAVSPVVTLEPRRRKYHQPVLLTVPLPKAFQRGMINQYTSSGGTGPPNLRLLCSVFGTPLFYYLRQGGNVFAGFCLSVCLSVCLFVCLCVSKITQKVMDGSFWNFESMSGVAQTTSDSILEVVRQESWILDHFEIFVTIALKAA